MGAPFRPKAVSYLSGTEKWRRTVVVPGPGRGGAKGIFGGTRQTPATQHASDEEGWNWSENTSGKTQNKQSMGRTAEDEKPLIVDGLATGGKKGTATRVNEEIKGNDSN